MMRIFILMLMLMLVTTIWGSNETNEFNINNSETNKKLTIEQCQANEDYVTIEGRYVDAENQCLRSPEPVGCMKADIGCEEALAIAQAPNGKCYWFSNLCIPNGWQVIKNDNDPSCRQSDMNLNECPALKATTFQSTALTWNIGQPNSIGFRIWRVVEEGTGEYKTIATLKEINSYQGKCIEGKLMASGSKELNPPISKASFHSNQESCYSFIEIGVTPDQTYYYVLEEIDLNGNSIFHCNDMVTVSVGEGLPIHLNAAKSYCQQVTGSED